jgi:hypothetical protein
VASAITASRVQPRHRRNTERAKDSRTASHLAAVMAGQQATATRTQRAATDHRQAASTVGPVGLVGLVEVLVELVPSTDLRRLDSEAQAQHRAAAAAVAVHLVSLTTVAVVGLVRRVASCSRIRQQQAADEDGEYS